MSTSLDRAVLDKVVVSFSWTPFRVLQDGDSPSFSAAGFTYKSKKAVPASVRNGTAPPSNKQRRRPLPAFARMGDSFQSVPNTSQQSTQVIENATGIYFPAEYCCLTERACPRLAGVGARSKRIAALKINVYALALYVDIPSLKARLKNKYRDETVETLRHKQTFLNEVIGAADVEKTLRLTFSTKHITQSKFWSSLNDALLPKLESEAEGRSALVDFGNLFNDLKFKKGLSLCFTSDKSSLLIQVDDRKVGTIKSEKLQRAIFDVYLGTEPVSQDAKYSIAHGLATMLLTG